MRSGFPVFIIVILLFIFAIDLYAFRGIRILTGNMATVWRSIVNVIYWMVPILILILLILMIYNAKDVFTTGKFKIFYLLTGIFVLFYAPKLVFIIFQLGTDIVRLSGWIMAKFSSPDTAVSATAATMSRSEFLTKVGIIVALIPFVSIINGIWKGRYNYKIKNVKLHFNNLPAAFDGYRVLQISDWHIGSFYGRTDKIEEAVDLINSQKADIILFTGDMVNNVAEEMLEFVPVLKQLKAPDGVYSILGNHDYGEYVNWKSDTDHDENMQRLFANEKEAGFRLLRNESFVVERDLEKIGIAGVENWGLPPFQQYGDLNKATADIRNIPFKILMSHDPSHWDAEVLEKTDINLTLSGHTHGFQFGINIPGLKWSPVKWKYPRWAGLYEEGKQKLYVNVGIGYIAFPGRVGFTPEVTVFELHRG